MSDPDLLNYREAAAELRCGERTFRRLVYDGQIAAIRVGGLRYIERRELEDFLARQRAQASRRRAAAARSTRARTQREDGAA